MKTNRLLSNPRWHLLLVLVGLLAAAVAGGASTPLCDFNGDGKPDLLLYKASTRQTAIWYLNNNVFTSGLYGPTLPVGWTVVGAADFNGDGHPDYLVYNASTRQTAIWYLNNNILTSGLYGPTLPVGWTVVGVADFNGDGHPDYLLYNASTRQTAIWYLNNNILTSGLYGPTLPAGWTVTGLADFNGDGHPDYLLYKASTRQTAIWYLNNNVLTSGLYGPTPPVEVLGVADFDGDGHPDYLLFNAPSQTAISYLNNNVFIRSAGAPILPAGWSLAGSQAPNQVRDADFGSSYSNSKVPYAIDRHAVMSAIGYPTAYANAVAYGDFNSDGIPDVVFAPVSGTTTGLPIIIALGQPGGSYIDGTSLVIAGEVPAPIHPRKIIVGDFNGDGRPDIFVADHGYDQPPFPGSHDWLLLSDGTGHLVYQKAFAATEPVGFHHAATAGDIDNSGHLDIFVTGNLDLGSSPYFLINDGSGHFKVDTTKVPASLLRNQLYTCELVDIDHDGNLDLVVGGHEYAGMPTEIFWGNGTGFYSDGDKTVLPGDTQFDIALDIDAEDLNHDGLRDLVITRTAHLPQFYTGFYFQVVMQTSRHVFADQSLSRLIGNRSTWMGNTASWVDWIHLVDMNGDGAPDIVVDDAARHLGWLNNGSGIFTFTGGW
jgi:elongation factor P hydroxylase